MAWAYWLAAPLVATLVSAAGLWLRARPPRPLDTRQSIAGHRAYLDALETFAAAPAAPTPMARSTAGAATDVTSGAVVTGSIARRPNPRAARYDAPSPKAVAGPA